MAYLTTLEDLMVRVKQLMNKLNQTAADDTGKPSNAQIIASINEARFETYADVSERLPDRFATTTTMVYPANQDSMSLPTDAQGAQMLHVYTRQQTNNPSSFQSVLSPLRIREFANVGETGEPKYYALTGSSIRLRPVPTSDANLVIYYLPTLTPLALTTDTFGEMTDTYAHIYALGAAIKLRQINEEGAGGLIDAYDKLLERYVASIERRVPDNHAQIVDQAGVNPWQG